MNLDSYTCKCGMEPRIAIDWQTHHDRMSALANGHAETLARNAALEARVRELEGYESRAKEAESALYCIVIHGYTPGEKDGMTCRCSFETAETVRRLYRRAGFPIPAALATPTAAGEAADAGTREGWPKLGAYVYSRALDGAEHWIIAAESVSEGLTKAQTETILAALATQPPAAPTPDADLLERVEGYIREQRAASLEGRFAASAWDEMVKAAEALRQRKGA